MLDFKNYAKKFFNKIVNIEGRTVRLVGFCHDDFGNSYISINENGKLHYSDTLSRIQEIKNSDSIEHKFKKYDDFLYQDFRELDN